MKTKFLLILLALLTSLVTGCATTEQWQQAGRRPSRSSLASAGATKAQKVQKTPKSEAVAADQLLFKRALLSLRPTQQVPVSKRGRELLKRLKKEYPSSPWTAQAAPVIELINVTDDLLRENQDLKATNRSLIREINELNDSIKQLKDLDRELEEKR